MEVETTHLEVSDESRVTVMIEGQEGAMVTAEDAVGEAAIAEVVVETAMIEVTGGVNGAILIATTVGHDLTDQIATVTVDAIEVHDDQQAVMMAAADDRVRLADAKK